MIFHVLNQPRPDRRALSQLSGREPRIDGLTLMDAVEQELKIAVERQHGGTAHLAYIDAVSATIQGRSVWGGIVLVFDLHGQAEAEFFYNCTSTAEGSRGREAHVVLQGPAIRSAYDAVIAALLASADITKCLDARPPWQQQPPGALWGGLLGRAVV